MSIALTQFVWDHPRFVVNCMLMIVFILHITTGFEVVYHHYRSVLAALVCVSIYLLLVFITIRYFVYHSVSILWKGR